MANLYTFLGISLKNPLFIASCPATETAERLMLCDRYGAGGAILKTAASYTRKKVYEKRRVSFDDCGYYASSSFDREIMTAKEGLELFTEASQSTSLLLVPSVTAFTLEASDWLPLCRAFEERGAKLLQLDFFYAGTQIGTKDFREKLTALLSTLRTELGCELMPKLNCNLPADYISALVAFCGIKAVSVLDSVRVPAPLSEASKRLNPASTSYFGAWQLPLTLHYTDAASRAGLQSCAGGGAVCGRDLLRLFDCGAGIVQIASPVLLGGYEVIPRMLRELEDAKKERAAAMVPQNNSCLLPAVACALDNYNQCRACITQSWCSALRIFEGRITVDPAGCEACGFCSGRCKQQMKRLSDRNQTAF